MNYEKKTKGELISELKSLKSKVENFEYKQSEGELKKAVTLMTNVINSTPDLIFVKDMKLRTIMCNKAFANATGKKPDEMIGRLILKMVGILNWSTATQRKEFAVSRMMTGRH